MDVKDTKILKIDSNNPEIDKIKSAAEVIKQGGTVAFPTETVYGLGANALDTQAIDKIFKAKGRPQDNPLIVHIAQISQLDGLVESIPEKAFPLMEKFWPGPLTLIFNRSSKVPDKITGGLSTVAIRMPNHNIALQLIKHSALPIAAPSANISGKPSPTEVSHVVDDLFGKIDIIVDGGSTGVGLESTVLDVSSEVPVILRPGGITLEHLLDIFPKVEYDPALEGLSQDIVPKSPGQKYKHYSPKASMKIIQGEIENVCTRINELSEQYEREQLKVGIMATKQTHHKYDTTKIMIVGDREKPETIAANLFSTLREFDKLGVDIILAEGIDEAGIGKAVMNRMSKAAGGDIIYTD